MIRRSSLPGSLAGRNVLPGVSRGSRPALYVAVSLLLSGLLMPLAASADGPVLSPEQELAAEIGVEQFRLVDLGVAEPGADALIRTLPLGDVDRTLVLRPHSLRADDFRLLVTDWAGEPVEMAAPSPRTYRGDVDGVESAAAVSVTLKGGLRGLVAIEGEGEWGLEPVPESYLGRVAGDHVVYATRDVLPGSGICGTPDRRPGLSIEDDGVAEARGSAAIYVCEIACDADFEYYQRNGSDVAATIADIEQVLAAVELIYERDVEITYELTTVLVRTTEPDPYSSTSPSTLLSQFRSHWQNSQGGIQRDVAHLFTGKNLDGSVIGIAWLGVICGSSGYGLSQAQYTTNFLLRTSLVAHELGHNWDSAHCSGSDCRIMCPSNGGCTGDVTRFGQSSRNQIISHRNSRGCLDQIPLPDPLEAPFLDIFPSTTIDGSRWLDVDGATVDTGASNEPSGPYALRLDAPSGGGDRVDSNRIDLSSTGRTPLLSWWAQGRNLEGGETLRIEYFDRDFRWSPLVTLFGDDTPSDWFRFGFTPLDGPERHARFELRLRAVGDDANDVYYLDNVQIRVPDVVVDLSAGLSVVTAGETFPFDASVTNVSGAPTGVDAWIDVYRPDGSPLFGGGNPKFGPKSVNLVAGETKGRNGLGLRVPVSTPPAFNYRVVAFAGTFPDEVQYAAQVFFRVVAP